MTESSIEKWINISEEYFEDEKFNRQKNKSIKNQKPVSCLTYFWGRSGLSLASRKASSMVKEKRCNIPPLLMRNHAVGAVGYAEVCQPDPLYKEHPIFRSEFFTEGNRYRVRFRHSNIYLDRKANCEVCDDDDSKSCIREAAIKFGDQKRDGPFNLILFTGRTALASNSVEYNKLMRLDSMAKWKSACLENPDLCFALVDGLRRSPSSFAGLTYHSQIVYLCHTPDNKTTKGEASVVKFRLVPGDYPASPAGTDFSRNEQIKETGMLTVLEQRRPWETKRCSDDDKNYRYLVNDFKSKLFDKNLLIKYRLQVQGPREDTIENHNPQMIWNEKDYPWIDLMIIELTTYLTKKEVKKTYFNICDIPPGLSFPLAEFEKEYRSLQKVMISVYTKFERRSISQINDCSDRRQTRSDHYTSYNVEVTAQALRHNEAIPNVDIYIQLLGVRGRTGCHQLDDVKQGRLEQPQRRRCDFCQIDCERVGELLGIIVDVEYRSLSEDYYLSSVQITYNEIVDAEKKLYVEKSHTFPCYQIVTSNIFLPTGEVSLIQKQVGVVMEKERKLELCDRKRAFTWRPPDSKTDRMPGRIQCDLSRLESLPIQVRSIAGKYTGLRWEVDPDLIDFFREFRSAITTVKMLGSKMQKIKKGGDRVDGKASTGGKGAAAYKAKGASRSDAKLGGIQGSKLSTNNMTVRNFSDIPTPAFDQVSPGTVSRVFEENHEKEKTAKQGEVKSSPPDVNDNLPAHIATTDVPKISVEQFGLGELVSPIFGCLGSIGSVDTIDGPIKEKKSFSFLVKKHTKKKKVPTATLR